MYKKIKFLFKQFLYYSGFLSLFHKVRNRKTLTVIMLHRVLSINDIRWKQADMDWTLSDIFYQDCLCFFNKHYNIISLDDINLFINKGTPLPDYALLVTFDDGWSDNYDYALDISQDNNINPLLFVTTSSIGKKILSWQEALYSAWKVDLLSPSLIESISNLINYPKKVIYNEKDIYGFINVIQASSSKIKTEVRELAYNLAGALPGKKQMLSVGELKKLFDHGFSMGTHGVIHEPYTQVKSALDDMIKSKEQLSNMISSTNVTSMSFPHSQLNDSLINLAVEAGYTTLFTGDICLNRMKRSSYCILGRLNIDQSDFLSANGHLIPSAMAIYLFKQNIKEIP